MTRTIYHHPWTHFLNNQLGSYIKSLCYLTGNVLLLWSLIRGICSLLSLCPRIVVLVHNLRISIFFVMHCQNITLIVCWSLTSLCHSNGHIETMPAREINPFTALTRIRSQFLRTQWSTSNHSEWTRLRIRPLSHRGWPKHHIKKCMWWPTLVNVICKRIIK